MGKNIGKANCQNGRFSGWKQMRWKEHIAAGAHLNSICLSAIDNPLGQRALRRDKETAEKDCKKFFSAVVYIDLISACFL